MSEPNRVYEQLVADGRVLPSGKIALPIVAANLTYEGRRYRIVVDKFTPTTGRPLRAGAVEPPPRPRLSFTVEIHETDAMGGAKWDKVRSSHLVRPLMDALLNTILQLTVPFEGMPEPPPLVTSPDERPAVWDRLNEAEDGEDAEKEVGHSLAELDDRPFMTAVEAPARYQVGGPEDLTEG